MIGVVIARLLKDNATVFSLVGNKIDPLYVPQGTDYPAVTYQQIGDVDLQNCARPVGRLDEVRVQINVFAGNYKQTVFIDEAIRNAIDNYSGTVENIQVRQIKSGSGQDQPRQEDQTLYHRSRDYKITIHT